MYKKAVVFLPLIVFTQVLFGQNFIVPTLIDSIQDSIIKYGISKSNIINATSTKVSKERYNKIRDSLKNDGDVFKQNDRVYYYRLSSAYAYTLINHDTIPIGFDDSIPALDYYYAERTTKPDDDGRLQIFISHLQTEQREEQFPDDSIGHFDYKIDFSSVDSYAKTVGFYPPQILADKLTRPFKTEVEKVRAIYYWIAVNINYDYKGYYSQNENEYTWLVNDVLKKRIAVCSGYSNLFKTLCDDAKISSKVIEGYSGPVLEHAWNVVRIDCKWYLLDVTWGSTLNNDYYFLCPPEYFINDHYSPPPYEKWNLLKHPPTLKEFNLSSPSSEVVAMIALGIMPNHKTGRKLR